MPSNTSEIEVIENVSLTLGRTFDALSSGLSCFRYCCNVWKQRRHFVNGIACASFQAHMAGEDIRIASCGQAGKPLFRRRLKRSKGRTIYLKGQNVVDAEWQLGGCKIGDEPDPSPKYKMYAKIKDQRSLAGSLNPESIPVWNFEDQNWSGASFFASFGPGDGSVPNGMVLT